MLYEITESLISRLQRAGLKLGLAESCTGGLIAHSITQIPGASAVFVGGVVAYSNEFKTLSLEIAPETLEKHGAVSQEVAECMAEVLLRKGHMDIVGSVTGIAGPSGGTPEKPVGTVHIAVATRSKTLHRKLSLKGDRRSIQEQSAKHLLLLLKEMVDNLQ